MAEYLYITVETQYGAWTDWETNMATAFATQTAPDVNVRISNTVGEAIDKDDTAGLVIAE